jgi:hypothetical protein
MCLTCGIYYDWSLIKCLIEIYQIWTCFFFHLVFNRIMLMMLKFLSFNILKWNILWIKLQIYTQNIIYLCLALGKIKDLKILFDCQRLGSFMEMLFGGRYVILLMSLFSMYCGLIYNEFFSVPFHIFGASAYKCRDMSCRCLLFVSFSL